MSSRGGSSSRGRAGSSNASSRPSDIAGPSSHRFAERRQERMRGAGTAVAMQRDFQFKLPPKRTTAPTTTTASTAADASTSTDNSEIRRRPGRPRGSGPKQRAAAEQEEEGLFRGEYSPPPLSEGGSAGIDPSSSIGVGRRVARISNAPISSTPAASRIRKEPQQASLSRPSAQRTYAEQDDEESLGSQIGEDGNEYSGLSGNGASMMNVSPGGSWDGGYPGVDESLPMIPSPAVSSSHVGNSIRRTRPSIGGTSVSRLSIADSTHGDSPAARAAQRNLVARQQRRQGSPGAERQQRVEKRPRGRPPKSASAQAQKRSRAILQLPSESDETMVDRTMVERIRANSSTSAPVRGKDVQKRLKRALTLVFSPDDVDDSTAREGKKKKSAKYLNDVDIIWSLVDEELRSSIEEQPAKAPFLALKALRKSVRANFLNLSEKTDNRTTLISQLLRVRKQKRLLRQEVFKKRFELGKVTTEKREREKELQGWAKGGQGC